MVIFVKYSVLRIYLYKYIIRLIKGTEDMGYDKNGISKKQRNKKS